MKVLGAVIKSASDKRVYKAIELPNKLTCLIVSDKEAEKSSSALSVQAGSLQDPRDAQGLAHYLQHMLFMGTVKYPDQNQYSKFLTNNSGSSNAYTSQDQTNYFFQVSSTAFPGALDRFAQFFIQPLMNQNSSQRQLMAVHSEHTKNLLSDPWRQYQLLKSSAKENHPLNKFSTGDKNTLGGRDVREKLLGFYKRNYSANLMKLVVYGKEDVDKMSRFVEETFGGIPNQNLQPFRLTELPFDENNLGNMYKVVPIKNVNTVEYLWFLPSYEHEYKNSPGEYISHLLGHEGPGSLLSFLKKEGLVLSLSSSHSEMFQLYSNLSVRLSLTDKGLENIPKITGYLLYYIEMMKKQGPQKWVFDEIKKVKKLDFDFMEKSHGMSVCSYYSKNMHEVPVQQILVKPYLMEKWKPELITNYLSQIKQNNLRIVATSQKFEKECTQTEPIYGTKYSVQKLPKLQPIQCNVHLPPANPFFPEDLTVLPLSLNQQPVKLESNTYIDLFFKPDHQFELAKGQVKIRLYYPGSNTAQQRVIRDIFINLLDNHLQQLQYMGKAAQIHTSLSLGTYCLDLDFSGFNDSLCKFLPQYLQKVMSFLPNNPTEFSNTRTKRSREYMNFFMANPYQQAYEYHLLALKEGGDVDPAAKVAEINKVEFEKIIEFSEKWKQNVFGEVYVAGNYTEERAREFGRVVEGLVKRQKPLDRGEIKTVRAVNLRENQVWAVQKDLVNKNEKNSSLILHFQYQQLGIATKVLQDFSMNFIKEPAFDYLRTKQQLGYIVMCIPDDNRGILGLSILVQSNVKCSHELRGYVENLMGILRTKLDNFTNEQFERIKQAAYNVKLQKDKTLGIESNRFWTEIAKHTYEFARRKKQLQYIKNLKLDEFKQFFTTVFLDHPKRFEVHVTSSEHKQANDIARDNRLKKQKLRIVPSIDWFKKRMPLHPDYYALL